MDDKTGKEKASNNRGTDFHSRGELEKAIECHQKDSWTKTVETLLEKDLFR